MTTGVKDQLKDQMIKNKRATRSDTTWQFLDPLKHNWIKPRELAKLLLSPIKQV